MILKSKVLVCLLFIVLGGASFVSAQDEVEERKYRFGMAVDFTPMLERIFSGTSPENISTINMVWYGDEKFHELYLTPSFSYSDDQSFMGSSSFSHGLVAGWQYGRRVFKYNKFGVLVGFDIGLGYSHSRVDSDSQVQVTSKFRTYSISPGMVTKLEYWLADNIALRTQWPWKIVYRRTRNIFEVLNPDGSTFESEESANGLNLNFSSPQIIQFVYFLN